MDIPQPKSVCRSRRPASVPVFLSRRRRRMIASASVPSELASRCLLVLVRGDLERRALARVRVAVAGRARGRAEPPAAAASDGAELAAGAFGALGASGPWTGYNSAERATRSEIDVRGGADTCRAHRWDWCRRSLHLRRAASKWGRQLIRMYRRCRRGCCCRTHIWSNTRKRAFESRRR